MRKSRATIVLALLLIAGQCHMMLHAAEFGSHLHYHDDVACTIVLPEDEYDFILLPQSTAQIFIALPQPILHLASQFFVFSPVGIRPPSNGPPLSTC